MDYLSLFSPHNLALISDWLAERGELYVDVYMPHSGGGSTSYFIRSINHLKTLVSQQDWPEIAIAIFRHDQYPLRGVADEILLEKALKQIPDGQSYSIVSLSDSVLSPISHWGDGNSHEEFKKEFADVLGDEVGIGQNPFDVHDSEWFRSRPDEVFEVHVLRKNQFAIIKNQDYYEPYAQNPERYKDVIDFWMKK